MLFFFFFSISFCILARCKRELAENDPADSRWCIYPKQWWILPVKINQLPQVGSASSSCCLHSSFSCHLLSAAARSCRASSPRFSSGGLNPFHTLASRGPPLPFTLDLIDLQSLLDPLPLSLPNTFSLLPSVFFSLFYILFSSPPLPPLSLHPSHWVMAIRAGSRPAAVGDRHWSHTQSLGAEGKTIHPVCARPCFYLWPYCTLAGPSNYRRPDCWMKQIKLKGECAELFIHYLHSSDEGWQFTSWDCSSLKKIETSTLTTTWVIPIQTTTWKGKPLSCLKDVFLLWWWFLFSISPQCSAHSCSSETENLCFIEESAELPLSTKWSVFQFYELSL